MGGRAAAGMVVALVAAGCVQGRTTRYTIQMQAIHRQVPALRRQGAAVVDVYPAGSRRIALRDTFSLPTSCGPGAAPDCVDETPFTVAQLIEHCPAVVPFDGDEHARRKYTQDPDGNNCLLMKLAGSEILVREKYEEDWLVSPGTVLWVLLPTLAFGAAVTAIVIAVDD